MDQWYTNDKFDFYWQTYARCMNNNLAQNSSHNQFFENYNKFTAASLQASRQAHVAALNAMKNLSIDEPHRHVEKKVTVKKTKKQVEFEVTDEMIKFYEESIRFKKERDEAEKKKFQEQVENNRLDETRFEKMNFHESTKSAPLERAGTKREEELRELYGERAAQIHMAETSLQLRHDKNFDAHRPSYWPNFPLRVKFQ